MPSTIFQKIENAGSVDFGGILSKSFEFFKDIWEEALYHALMSMIVVVPFIILVYAPFIPMYIEMLESSRYGGYYNEPFFLDSPGLIIGYVVLILFLAIVMQVVTISIAAHFYRVCKAKDTGLPVEVGGYFDSLKEHFGKILILSLATFGIALLATLLCYLPIFYVMVPLQLIVPLYAFNKELEVSDLIKAAFKLGNKFWITVFGLVIISSMIAQVGIILCIVGVFFTAYFVHIPMYFFYKDSVGFDEVSEEISA